MNDKDKPAANKNTNDNAAIKKPVADEKQDSQKKPTNDKLNKPTLSSRILLILLIFISGMGLSIYLMPTLTERVPFIANWIGSEETNELASLSQRIDTQQNEITTLKQKTVELENALNNIPTAGRELATSDIEDRIAALETLVSSGAPGQDAASIPVTDTSQSARIDMLLSRMSQLEASFVPLSRNMLDAGQAKQERDRIASETATFIEKLAALENRLSNVEHVAAKDNSGILLNLKIADLKRAYDRGNPYTVEISAIEQIINNGTLSENAAAINALATLQQQSGRGITTIDQSARQFNVLIPNILKEEGKDQNDYWVQNTFSSLKNLITVRQTDSSAPTASELDTIIAQIEDTLSRRDPHAAANAADALPENIRAILSPWRVELQSLIDGSDAIVILENIATKSYLHETSVQATLSEASL